MRKTFFLLFLGFIGCGDLDEKHSNFPSDINSASLHGTVQFLGPVEGVRVCALPLQNARRDVSSPVCIFSRRDGSWEFPSRAFSDALLIVADGTPLEFSLKAVVSSTENDTVVISPLTTLAAGYVEYALSAQHDVDDAMRVSQERILQHFHPLDSQDGFHNSVDADTSLFENALAVLAERYNTYAGKSETREIALGKLVEQLYQDIRHDGEFNGQGIDGTTLVFNGVPLSGDTLTRDLAVAMKRFADRKDNLNCAGCEDATSLIAKIASARPPVFQSLVRSKKESDTSLAACQVTRQNGSKTSLEVSQKGKIEIRCHWDSLDEVVAGHLTYLGENQATVRAGVVVRDDTFIFTVSTDEVIHSLGLSNDDSEDISLRLVARDASGMDSETLVRVNVDNRQLKMKSLKATRHIADKESLHVRGEFNRPLKSVEVAGCGDRVMRKEFLHTDVVSDFDFEYDALCGDGDVARVSVEDWLENTYAQVLELRDTKTPTLSILSSPFVSDVSGEKFDFQIGPWPAVLKKLYSKLDFLPEQGLTAEAQNIPVLKFSVSSSLQAANHLLYVSYKYSVVGRDDRVRDWEPLRPSSNANYDLPLSYQTLLPREILQKGGVEASRYNFLARSKVDDLHRVDISVSDADGNSRLYSFVFRFDIVAPSLIISECRKTQELTENARHYAAVADAFSSGFPLFTSNISYNAELPQNSVSPRGKVSFKLGEHNALTRIKSVFHQAWSVKEKDIPAARLGRVKQSMVDPANSLRPQNCKGAYAAWEDEGCTELLGAEIRMRQIQKAFGAIIRPAIVTKAEPEIIGRLSSYLIADQAKGQHVTPGSEMQVCGGGVYKLWSMSSGDTLKWKSQSIDLRKQQSLGNDTKRAVFLSHDFGVLGEFSAGSQLAESTRQIAQDAQVFVERNVLLRELELRYTAPEIIIVDSDDDLPTPTTVQVDPSCRTEQTVKWAPSWFEYWG